MGSPDPRDWAELQYRLSVPLSLLAFALQRRIATARDFDVVGGKSPRAPARSLGVWQAPVLALFGLVAFVSTGLPLLAILATALSRTISGGLAPNNIGLLHFEAILSDTTGAMQAMATIFAPGAPVYIVIYSAIIIFFAYFYTAVILNPVDLADNMKKNSGFIPGVRPGKKTAEYIDRVLTRVTLPGAVFLAAIAIPNLLTALQRGKQIT